MVLEKLAYIIAVVNEFAARFSLNSQQAYRYLDRFKGIGFVDEFYNVEHTLPFDDVVDDLTVVCRKNGGAEQFVKELENKKGETFQYYFGTDKSLKYLKKL